MPKPELILPPEIVAKTRKEHREKVRLNRVVKDVLLIVAGIFSAGFGLESFLMPNKFIDGGATGIALLSAATTGLPLPILILLINLPFVIMGYKTMGRSFGFKTALGIAGLAIVISTVHFPVITDDKLLTAVFGGAFLGAGIGLAMRGGGVLDGTEVLAIAISKKLRMTIGDVILSLNLLIFSAAAYLLSLEVALYSILTYLSASKAVNFLIEGIEEYTGITIISSHSEEIRKAITEELGRGVTIYKGKRGYGKKGDQLGELDILYTVITRLEVSRMNATIEAIDPEAFVVMNSVKDTIGGLIKKRPLH